MGPARVNAIITTCIRGRADGQSDVSRLLRLTLLSPDIVEAILDGWQPEEMTLPGLMEPFPV